MNPFARALREAAGYWPLLAASFVCSLFAAALWGGSIATVFPLLETMLQGKSLQVWNAERLANSQKVIAELETQLALPPPAADAPLAERQLRTALESKLQAERALVFSAEQFKPWAERYLPRDPFATVLLMVSLLAAATLLKQVFSLTNAMLVQMVSQNIARGIRKRLFDRALVLDRPTFNRYGVSGFSAQIMHTTDMLAQGVTSFFGGAVSEPLRIAACLCGAWMICWRLTLISLIFAPAFAFMVVWLNRRMRQLAGSILRRSQGIHHVMLEAMQGLTTVQAFSMEPYERQRFAASASQLRRGALQFAFFNALAGPLTEVLGMAVMCTAMAASAYLVVRQETRIFGVQITDHPLGVSTVMLFFGMLLGATDPLRKMTGVITGINSGMTAANLIYPLLDAQPLALEPAEPKTPPRPHQRLEFRNVKFGYDPAHPVLAGVNVTIPFGERLAIVGPNGGGKSTFINLLCRFYDPQEGTIELDGIPLGEMSLRELRSRLALVSQQTELFNDTILHNIRYGRWDATDEEVFAAARQARAEEFITGFPEGYATVVGPNGQRLSGGQRQRISLARAILRKAEVLILDEATSQIDVESEKQIHRALASLAQHCTLIMITHRESTLSLATQILEIEAGTVRPRAPVRQCAA